MTNIDISWDNANTTKMVSFGKIDRRNSVVTLRQKEIKRRQTEKKREKRERKEKKRENERKGEKREKFREKQEKTRGKRCTGSIIIYLHSILQKKN